MKDPLNSKQRQSLKDTIQAINEQMEIGLKIEKGNLYKKKKNSQSGYENI